MLVIFIFIATLCTSVYGWTTCEAQKFCNNIRHNFDENTSYSLTNITIGNEVTGNIVDRRTSKLFTFQFVAICADSFRLTIQDPKQVRYTPENDTLSSEPILKPFVLISKNDSVIELSVEHLLVNIYLNPFQIELLRNKEIIIKVNKANRLVINSNEDDNSLALDISFPIAKSVYGIPQHAERLSLPTTASNGSSAFRLYNVDYYGYPVLTREAIYGSIPVLYGISTAITAGIFWMNAAQTFVDITNNDQGVDSLFMSESGAVELFLFGGPTLKDCVRQYTALTGITPLPQYFSLGYHQSRYSYMSQEDVESVVAKFDENKFPIDVIWLDIDYTDGYRYFTWNSSAFPNPMEMQDNIVATGRKVVAISDPHIKIDKDYFVYNEGLVNGHFVKNPNGTIFEGNCWPGLSHYPDFLNPDTQKWYGDLYLLENFRSSTLNLYIWNDMNEPSVFDLPDQTMPPDVLHYNGWKHYDIHNLYGLKHTQATYFGLLKRNPTKRPFILTRAHFSGSQRYSAMWTGDNSPTWEHLRISIPMILSESLAGMVFCGADIGGFTANVKADLLQRWYQAGVWYPFYRGHSGKDTERREPYLFSKTIQGRIRRMLNVRYAHIPYWYTLFFEHMLTGDPIVRPLSYQYPNDETLFPIDTQWLVGNVIMVAPVLYKGVSTITTIFPGGSNEYWYDTDNMVMYPGTGSFIVNVSLDSAPYYYRGGSIVLKTDGNVRSTEYQRNSSFSIHIFLNKSSEAAGTFYLDDWESFDYKNKLYHYYNFQYNTGTLSTRKIYNDTNFNREISINKIILYSVNATKDVDVQKIKRKVINKEIKINQLKNKFALRIVNI